MHSFPPPDSPPAEAPEPRPRRARHRRRAWIAGGAAAAVALSVTGLAVAVTGDGGRDDGDIEIETVDTVDTVDAADTADEVDTVGLASETAAGDVADDLTATFERLGAFGECVADRIGPQMDGVETPTDADELASTVADGLRAAADAIEACADELPDDLDVLLDLPLGPGLLPDDLDVPTLDELRDELQDQLDTHLPELGELKDLSDEVIAELDELNLDELNLDELWQRLDDALADENVPGEIGSLLDELFGRTDDEG
jgi:hypothetical protein